MIKKIVCSLALFASIVLSTQAQIAKKREFRGAWIQAVNGQFQGLTPQQMQETLRYQLNELQKDGVNAIIFQVRPECDALYQSAYEPWSKFLSGKQGVAPSPYWDPLSWMITECHQRGMELHAWINPFRAKTANTSYLAPTHITQKYPNRAFSYNNQLILDPGLPENRTYICKVVNDIVRRYDIDGLHIDDYFYPYPTAGQVINDEASYKMYGNNILSRADWRRDNVNIFIKQLSDSIHTAKPWVKFGVSPFGIYRNAKNDNRIGSATNGLQNYDDLYADVLLWVNNGWVDYCVPQLYWQIGNKAADYEVLIKWWNKYASNRPLFIGEDVERTVKYADTHYPNQHQMAQKFALRDKLPHIQGAVLWYAKAAVDNIGNYGTMLKNNYWKAKTLQPLMPFIDDEAPNKPKRLKAVWTIDGYMLFWKAPKGKTWQDKAHKYVVYRFIKGEPIDLENAEKIVGITENTFISLPYVDGSIPYVYVVSALDRMSNESRGVKKKVKL